MNGLKEDQSVCNINEETRMSFEIWLDGIRKDRYEVFCNMIKKYLSQSKLSYMMMKLDKTNIIEINKEEDRYIVTATRLELRLKKLPIRHSICFTLDKNLLQEMIHSSTRYRVEYKSEIFTEKACYPLYQF